MCIQTQNHGQLFQLHRQKVVKIKRKNPSCDILTASNFPLNKNVTKLTDEIKITINYKPLEFLKHCQLPRKKKGCELLGTRDLFTERGERERCRYYTQYSNFCWKVANR